MKNLLKLEGTYLSFLFCIYFPYILTCYIFYNETTWQNTLPPISPISTDIRANGSIHVRIHFSTTRGKIRNNRSLLDRFSIADEGKANGGKSLSLDRSTSNYPRVSSFSSFAARPRWRAGIHCEKKVKKVGWNSPCKSRFPSRSYGAQHFTGLSSTEII